MYKTKSLFVVALFAISLFLVACNDSSQTSNASATPGVSVTPQMAHSALTAVPTGTQPPATVVPQPTSTIVANPTDLQGQVLQAAQKAAKNPAAVSVDTQSTTSSNVPGGATVVVLDNLNTQDQEAIKTEVFNLQKAVWNSPARNEHLGMFMVWITQGQTTAGDPVITSRASLSAQKAVTLQWSSLTPDAAWNLYDQNAGQLP